MKKITFLTLFLFIGYQAVYSQKKVLMVVSGYGKDKGKIRPGFELDELSQAYHIFKNHKLQIEIASPQGGKVEADGFNTKKPYNKAFIEDSAAVNLLKNTKSTAQVLKNDYDALYVVGGKGAMFDLPFDPSLQDLVLKMSNQNKIISAVCHGAAAFVNVKVNDSTFFVQNRKITGLCNAEETRFGKKWMKEFPFLLETKLIERKAKYEQTEVMLPLVVKDDNLITGQNPYSTNLVAEEIVKALGLEVQSREQYKDEKALHLVKKALNGGYDWAVNELKSNHSQYDMELMAVYGYYGLLFANGNQAELKKSLSIVEMATPYYFNENLHLERAKAHKSLGEKQKAKILLEELINKKLLVDESKKMMAEL